MVTLRPYQEIAVQKLRNSIRQKHKKIVLCSPTGSGKTVMFMYMVSAHLQRGGKCLIITDRIELLSQSDGALTKLGVKADLIKAGKITDRTFNCHIAMVETLNRRSEVYREFLATKTLVIYDECFIAGTKVGTRNIEDINPGDYVDSYNHALRKIEKKKVLRTFKNKIINDLYIIKFDCAVLVVTQEHPIFVKNKGYVTVKNLKIGDNIYVKDSKKCRRAGGMLRSMRKEIQHSEYAKKVLFKIIKTCRDWNDLLFKSLRGLQEVRGKFRAYDKKQPNDEIRNKTEGFGHIKGNWAQATDTRRKWERVNRSTKNIIRLIKSRLVSGIDNKDTIYSVPLQNRYSKSYPKNSNRGRWRFSWGVKSKGGRQEKTGVSSVYRVQSVEILKQSDYDRLGISKESDFVFNLEVDGNNNYFANGVLVHNCHKQAFNKIFPYINENSVVIGATATPWREGDQVSLHEYYTDLVEVVTTQQLIDLGFLSKAETYGVDVDLSKVGTKNGDYDPDQLGEMYSENKVYDGVIENYNRLSAGKKALVFCANIASSMELVQVANSEKWKHLDSYMASWERKKILQWFHETPDAVLSNVGILTTGFDAPEVETVILYRATKSLPLFLQMCGRGSRVIPGKKSAFKILDFGNNVKRHNFWESDRTWSLEKKKKKKGEGVPPIKECPSCGAYMPIQIKICTCCGYEWVKEVKKEDPEVVELQLLTKEQVNALYGQLGGIEKLVQLCKAKQLNPFAALHRFKTEAEGKEFVRLMGWKPSFVWVNRMRFKCFRDA